MSGAAYAVILLVGAIVVVVDGRLIARTSPAYLAEAYRDPGRARQVSTLVGLIFHLVMLGVVALIASVGLSPDAGASVILTRIGVLLILTALGHAGTIGVLSRLRDQQLSTDIAHDSMAAARRARTQPPTTQPPRTQPPSTQPPSTQPPSTQLPEDPASRGPSALRTQQPEE